jgi:hypothetical protein
MRADLTMLKHLDDIRKSAKERANRRWQNYATEKAFKAAQQEAANAPKEPKELEPADVLEQERLIKEATTKFESKFIKDIRAMLDEHKGRSVALYALSIRVRHKRLLMEKLRRLEAREAERAAASQYPASQHPRQNRVVLPKKDLFFRLLKNNSTSRMSPMRNCIILIAFFGRGRRLRTRRGRLRWCAARKRSAWSKSA